MNINIISISQIYHFINDIKRSITLVKLKIQKILVPVNRKYE